MFLNMDQLEKELDNEEFQEIGSMASFKVLEIHTTEEKVDTSKALDASLIDTKSSRTESKEQDTSSRSRNDAHADDADIRPIYDEEPMAEEREVAFVKPHHMIASSNSRNSSKNMPRFTSNDMVHNHYLEEAKNKTQDKVGLIWVPTGKIFNSSTTKVDSELTNGLDEDITNQYEYEQTLDVSVELGIHDHGNEPSSSKQVPKVVPLADEIATSQQELKLLFSPMYEKYFNAGNKSVSKSSALSDNSTQHDTQPTLNAPPTSKLINQSTNVDVAPLVPKLRKNRTAHTDYIRHTQDEAATLREIVESERLLSPLNTSLDYACSSCRALYTTDYCFSDGSPMDKIICDLDKTLDLSQRPPQNCPKCGNPVVGHYCQGCALLRKKFKEDLFTYCIENGILQHSSEPSNDNTNVVNSLQEPFVVKQKFLTKSFTNQPPLLFRDRPTIYYDDDNKDYAIAVTPSLSTKEPDNSLSMRDEHLDTVPTIESDEFIKSSVESLVLIPSESEGIPDNKCDVPFHDNSPPLDISKDQFKDFFYSNDGSTSTDDDSFSIDNIEYVEASPLDSELVSLETNTFDNSLPEDETFYFDLEEISSGSTTTRYDISLPEYESFYDDHVKEISNGGTTTHSDSSLYDSFIFDISINPFPPADRNDFYKFADELAHIISPPEYDCFRFKNEPNSGISLWMWWRIFFQQENQEFMFIMLCPPIPPFN
uniref:Uncharacterized protein n=1 Tax=Tanacetum cinerariifolium TaxID=118510 RepID=A0A6L2M174_TANCI|nr:hypothetical protein [Tanacetum cinerariifolium]